MQGQLFLGGGGDGDISKEMDQSFFENLCNTSKILYIPTAWEEADVTYSSCKKWFNALLNRYLPALQKEPVLLTENFGPSDITGFDAIYIGGGNTYKLLDFLFTRHLKEQFLAFIKNGGLIYGGSAGAIVFGKEISTVLEEKENYPEHHGLGLCPFSIRCHYTGSEQQLLQKIADKLQHKVYALPEDGGLILNNEYKIVKAIGDVVCFGNEI